MRYFNILILLIAIFLFFGGCRKQDSDQFLDNCIKAENAVKNEDYVLADELWGDIAQNYPDDWTVFYNWGTTLIKWGHCGGEEAVNRYNKACVQFEKAAAINNQSDLIFYNWGNAYANIAIIIPQDEHNYSQACEKYKKATEINPEKDQAFYNWGTVLSDWAELEGVDFQSKCQVAYNKFQRATEINPDKYEAFNNWGNTLIYQAKLEKNSQLLLQQAKTVFLKSEDIKKGHSAYNLARVSALLGDKEKCKQWLKVAEDNESLVSRKHAMEDEDLASVRDNDWFQNLKWKDDG